GVVSGRPLEPIALRMVHPSHRALPDFPICGLGGIASGEDVLEFLLAGASCVQVGTANVARPTAAPTVRDELRSLMASLGLGSVREVVGALQDRPSEPSWSSTSPYQESSG